MNDTTLRKLKSLDRIFLNRLKLLKLPMEERISKYSVELIILNNKLQKKINYFEENKVDEKVLKNSSDLSLELINFLKTKQLIKSKESFYKEPPKPIQQYIYTIKDLDPHKASIQFHQFLTLNNKKWKSSSRLIKHIDDFLKLELKLRSQRTLTSSEFHELEEEVENYDEPTLNKTRSLRRYLYLNANNKLNQNEKQFIKKSKVYHLIENHSRLEIKNLKQSDRKNIMDNWKKILESEKLNNKDLMNVKLEIGVEKFTFKYFDF